MEQAKRRKRACAEIHGAEDLTEIERVCEELREIQWKTNCSTLTLQTVLDSLRGELGKLVRQGRLPRQVTHADKKMQTMVRPKFYFVFTCQSQTNRKRRLDKKLFTCTGASVVQRSGDRETITMYVNCAVTIDLMTKGSRGNLSYTFHYDSASKNYSAALNTVNLCDGNATVRKAMMIISQVCDLNII